jgi:hypothetical protein
MTLTEVMREMTGMYKFLNSSFFFLQADPRVSGRAGQGTAIFLYLPCIRNTRLRAL